MTTCLLTSQVTDDETRARQVVSSAAPAPAESLLRAGEITELPLAAAPDGPWRVGHQLGALLALDLGHMMMIDELWIRGEFCEYTKGKAELGVWKSETQKKELNNLGIIWGCLV